MKKASSVDEYIASAPREAREKLKQIRAVIKKIAPGALEKLSYGMPYYGYKGRLAYFQLAKNHIGLYIPPPIVEEHKKELKDYTTSTATIRFPLNKKLPVTLIKKLVKARVIKNEEKSLKQ